MADASARREHGECLVFGGLHDGSFAWPLVVDAAEVEYAMYDHAVQLLVIVLAIGSGIGGYGIERDDKVAVELVALAVVEGDNVGEIVVLEILTVDLEDFLVGAEEVAHLAYCLAIGGGHTAYPAGSVATADGWHGHSLGRISDHGFSGLGR